MTNPKVVYSVDDLRLAIDKVFEEKLFKDDLIRDINNEFDKKGLTKRNFQLLLNKQIETINLKDYDLIAIGKVLYENFKDEVYNPKKYFGNNVLISYENAMKVEKTIDTIVLENFLKIDDYNYRGQITYKQIYEYLNNSLLRYDYDAQRSPQYREVGSIKGKAKKMRTENLNMKSVEEIANAILEGKFEDSEIILNCEMIEGKDDQKFKFINSYYNEIIKTLSSKLGIKENEIINELNKQNIKNDVIGNIIIKPNYDLEANDTTWVNITDGFHRCKGIISAVSTHMIKTGKWLEGSIGVRLVRADKERAKRIVHQTFLRSADEPEWQNALVDNDYSKFVDLVLNKSKKLTVENTIEEAEINNKVTSKSKLIDLVKKLPIAFNNTVQSHFKSNAIGENFDLIYDVVREFNMEMNPYNAIGYFYLAYKLDENKNLDIIGIVSKLKDNNEFKSISNKRNFTINKAIKVIDEVITNE